MERIIATSVVTITIYEQHVNHLVLTLVLSGHLLGTFFNYMRVGFISVVG